MPSLSKATGLPFRTIVLGMPITQDGAKVFNDAIEGLIEQGSLFVSSGFSAIHTPFACRRLGEIGFTILPSTQQQASELAIATFGHLWSVEYEGKKRNSDFICLSMLEYAKEAHAKKSFKTLVILQPGNPYLWDMITRSADALFENLEVIESPSCAEIAIRTVAERLSLKDYTQVIRDFHQETRHNIPFESISADLQAIGTLEGFYNLGSKTILDAFINVAPDARYFVCKISETECTVEEIAKGDLPSLAERTPPWILILAK